MRYIIIFFVLFFDSNDLLCQKCNENDYYKAIQDGDAASKTDYDKAYKEYDYAEDVGCTSEQKNIARNKKNKLFRKINKLRIDEQQARELAERNGNQSKANELAATAREIWASEHDSITALRLAEAAIKVSTPPTPRAIESMRDIATAAFTQPVKSYNLIKRYVQSNSDIEYLSFFSPFSPSLKYFITNSKDNIIRLWQLSNGQNINKFFKPNQSIFDFMFSQNDEYVMMLIISKDGKGIQKVLHLPSGNLLITYPDTLVNTVKKFFFLDNRPMLFYQSDSLFKILDISNQSIVKTIPQIKNFQLSTFQFSANGNRLFLSGTNQDGMASKTLIKIWDLERNIYSNELRPNKRHVAFTMSKDNKFLALAKVVDSIDIIDLESNTVIKTLKGDNSQISNLIFSDDSKFLVSGDIDGRIKLWDIEWGMSIQAFNIQNRKDLAYHIAISSDNKNIFTFSLGIVNVWRTIIDILDPNKTPTLTEEERQGYGVPEWIKD